MAWTTEQLIAAGYQWGCIGTGAGSAKHCGRCYKTKARAIEHAIHQEPVHSLLPIEMWLRPSDPRHPNHAEWRAGNEAPADRPVLSMEMTARMLERLTVEEADRVEIS